MTIKGRSILARCVVFGAVCFFLASPVGGKPPAGARPEDFVRVATCWAGENLLNALQSRFRKRGSDRPVMTGLSDNAQVSELLADHSIEAGIHVGRWGVPDYRRFAKSSFKTVKMLKPYPLGCFVVYVVVNAKNPVAQLTLDELAGIYRGKVKDWGNVAGGNKGSPIHIFSPLFNKTGYHVFKSRALQGYDPDKRLRDWSARTVRMKAHPDGVIGAVIQDVNAIGFFLFDHRNEVDKRVRVLGLVPRRAKKAVFPSEETIFERKYPLYQMMTMYAHPEAPAVAQDFCKFAASPENGGLLRKYSLFPEGDRLAYFAKKRLALMKAGKGVPIRGVGSMGGSAVMRDLAVEYVKAKEVVQMACRPATTELTAVGYFVNAKDRELLVLDGPISEKAKKLHGKKWDFLEPETHVLATGRGIAICVNSMNKLGTLTLEQVRHLFSKKTGSWRDVTGAEVKIKRYGLAGTDPAARVFYSRINPPAACARPDTRLGTQAVLAALSRDPHGIAFVDAAAANDLLGAAGGKSGIKVLSIGAKGKATSPTAANVKAGKYPISQQLTLHLSPRASQTTRDFVTYILSGAADEVFTKHGLITPAQARKAAAKKPTPKKPRKRSPKKNR